MSSTFFKKVFFKPSGSNPYSLKTFSSPELLYNITGATSLQVLFLKSCNFFCSSCYVLPFNKARTISKSSEESFPSKRNLFIITQDFTQCKHFFFIFHLFFTSIAICPVFHYNLIVLYNSEITYRTERKWHIHDPSQSHSLHHRRP